MQHAAEFLFQHAFVIAGDGKRLLHHVGAMIANGAGGKLDPVANDVVLVGYDSKYSIAISRINI